MNPKFDTYVAVFTEVDGKTVTRFVTSDSQKYARWDDGEPAMKLSESYAKDIVFGLTLNGYPSAVVKALHGVELSNPKTA